MEQCSGEKLTWCYVTLLFSYILARKTWPSSVHTSLCIRSLSCLINDKLRFSVPHVTLVRRNFPFKTCGGGDSFSMSLPKDLHQKMFVERALFFLLGNTPPPPPHTHTNKTKSTMPHNLSFCISTYDSSHPHPPPCYHNTCDSITESL